MSVKITTCYTIHNYNNRDFFMILINLTTYFYPPVKLTGVRRGIGIILAGNRAEPWVRSGELISSLYTSNTCARLIRILFFLLLSQQYFPSNISSGIRLCCSAPLVNKRCALDGVSEFTTFERHPVVIYV